MIKLMIYVVGGILMITPNIVLSQEICKDTPSKECFTLLLEVMQNKSNPSNERETAEDHFLNLSQKEMDIPYLLEIAKNPNLRSGFTQKIARIVFHTGSTDQKQEASPIVYPLWHSIISWFENLWISLYQQAF